MESSENSKLKTEVEQLKLDKLALMKDKQNAVNKLVVAESRLEALQKQEEFFNSSLQSVTGEAERLKGENRKLEKKLSQGGGVVVHKEIKDSEETTR